MSETQITEVINQANHCLNLCSRCGRPADASPHRCKKCKENNREQHLSSNPRNNQKRTKEYMSASVAQSKLIWAHAKNEGMTYWQAKKNLDLPALPKWNGKSEKFEGKIDLQSLDKRRKWHKGTPTGAGGPERSSGKNPAGAKEEREQKGLAELQRLYPAPYQIEDCRKYKKQVGCDFRVWMGETGKTLIARVDIKSDNRVTDAQLSVAYSSEDEGIPYYIFNPDTGQAMLINRSCQVTPKVFAVYAAAAKAAETGA